MKVLITSGGTTEPIDNVRGISNFATGSLGKVTAEKFLNAGHEVYLLAGLQAKLPEFTDRLTYIPIEGTHDLYEQMKNLVPDMDVVIHSMAVSDYRPIYMTGLENFTDKFSKEELLNFRPEKVGKISSKSDYQIMLLEKTPKIISYIKERFPMIMMFILTIYAANIPKSQSISTILPELIAVIVTGITHWLLKNFFLSIFIGVSMYITLNHYLILQ